MSSSHEYLATHLSQEREAALRRKADRAWQRADLGRNVRPLRQRLLIGLSDLLIAAGQALHRRYGLSRVQRATPGPALDGQH